MAPCRFAAFLSGLLLALSLAGAELQTRCRLTHFKDYEPQDFATDTLMSLVSVEARAAFPGDNPRGAMSSNRWGIEFDNGIKVIICRGNTDFGSEYNRPQLVVDICREDSLLQRTALFEGLGDKASEYHTLRLDFSEPGRMSVLAGYRDLHPVVEVELPAGLPAASRVECFHTGKRWTPAYLWIEELAEATIPVAAFDAEALARVGNGVGGMWQMYDRENDTRYALPGGEYTLACIPDPQVQDGYLLLMAGGAVKCPELWPAGAVKGRLRPTAFKDQYSLEWTTADGSRLQDEAYAQLREDNQLLTLVFPLHRATLRFTRKR